MNIQVYSIVLLAVPFSDLIYSFIVYIFAFKCVNIDVSLSVQ